MTLTDLLNGIGNKTVNDLRASMEKYGRNATGETSQAIRYEVQDKGQVVTFIVSGPEHLEALEKGRGPSTGDDGGVLKDKILDWIRAKPVTSNLDENTLAFLITRKIHRVGFKGTAGLITDVINDDYVKEFTKEVADYSAGQFLIIVMDEFNKTQQIIVNA